LKPLRPDEVLSAIVDSTPVPRGEMTKKLWNYIKRHGLQDATNKRTLNADDLLKKVFNGKTQVSMFEMTKLVSGLKCLRCGSISRMIAKLSRQLL
jgi:chromatin remodeling complex protein RSC6